MKRCHSPSRSSRIAVRLPAVLVLFSFLAAFLAAVAGAQESGAPASIKSQSGDAVDVSTFLQLSRADQAAFLLSAPDAPAIYADEYLRHSSFSAGDADLAQQQKIAERYFSKNPSSPNRNRISFVKFLKSHGVDLAMEGDITGYEYGVVTASNGVVPVQALAKKFRFVVGEDHRLYLISREEREPGGKRHSFEGMIRVVGGSMHLDAGSFDGQAVSQAQNIRIGSDGVVHLKTRVLGPLVFADQTMVSLLPSSHGRSRVRVDATRLENLPYTLAGTFTLLPEEEANRALAVAPQDTGFVNGYKIKGLGEMVRIFLKKEIVGPLENAVYFDEESSAVTFTSAAEGETGIAGAAGAAGTVNPFEVEFNPREIIKARQKTGRASPADFFAIPKKGYQLGERFEPGSRDYENLAAIQRLVGLTETGHFDEKTRSSLVAWQNAYNERNNLQRGGAGWLTPDGAWQEEDTAAYLDEISRLSRLTFRPKGGGKGSVTTIADRNYALDIQMRGDIDFVAGSEVYLNGLRGISKKNTPNNFLVAAPFVVTGYDMEGKETGSISRLGATLLEGNAVTRGMLNGQLCVPCYMDSKFDTSKSVCARFVRHTALAIGGTYAAYGPDKTTFDEYIGITGNAWTMSNNIREQGGTTLFWKDAENPSFGPFRSRTGLDRQVDYSNEQFQAGDVIGIYNGRSVFTSDASLYGQDGRRNSHVAFVLGKKQEAFSADGGALRPFLEKQLDVTDPVLLGNYPVWAKPAGVAASSFQKLKLADDGNYYHEADVVSGRKPSPGTQPVQIRAGDDVLVEKVIISHLYNTPQNVDLNHFLDRNPHFSIYEHMRPNQERLREARSVEPDVAVIQQATEQLEDELRAQGIPEHQLRAIAARIRRENNIPNPEKGDILFVSRGSNYDESRQ